MREKVVYYGLDMGNDDRTAYHLYDPVSNTHTEISEDEFKRLTDAKRDN